MVPRELVFQPLLAALAQRFSRQARQATPGGAEASVGGAAGTQLPGHRAVRLFHHVRGVQLPDHEPRRERERWSLPDPRHLVSDFAPCYSHQRGDFCCYYRVRLCTREHFLFFVLNTGMSLVSVGGTLFVVYMVRTWEVCQRATFESSVLKDPQACIGAHIPCYKRSRSALKSRTEAAEYSPDWNTRWMLP